MAVRNWSQPIPFEISIFKYFYLLINQNGLMLCLIPRAVRSRVRCVMSGARFSSGLRDHQCRYRCVAAL
jgi:hypothetical protein